MVKKRRLIIVGVLLSALLTLTGCMVPNQTDQDVILFDEWPVDGYPSDAAEITQVSLEENSLTIDVTYQGGCTENTI
jgi:hypothetical protein